MRVRYIKHSINGSNKNASSHFIEIQAYGTNSTNIAQGKTVTCDKKPTGVTEPITCIVDGVYNNSSLYFNVEEPNPTVIVDLGEVYDINMVKVWHVYADGRKYKDNILSVSEDGIYYEEQFNSNIDGEYAETSSGKEIVIDKPYKPHLSFNVEDGNIVINVSPYGNSINSIDMYLRNNRVATFDYNGANITHKIDVNTLAFGHNEYSFDVFYNTSEQINFKYVYDYNVVSVGSSTSLNEAVVYTSNMANTDERNKLMMAHELRAREINISSDDGIFDMIGKIKDISGVQKIAYGTGHLFDEQSTEVNRVIGGSTTGYSRIYTHKLFVEGSAKFSFYIRSSNRVISNRVVVVSPSGDIVFSQEFDSYSDNRPFEFNLKNIKSGYNVEIQIRNNTESYWYAYYSKLKLEADLL